MYWIDPEKCTGCEVCIDLCPVEAISMTGENAVIDEGTCTECGSCVEECVSEAIVEK